MRPLHQIWWLNPAWIGGLLGVAISIATILVPDSMYRSYWRTPLFFSKTDLLVCLVCTAMFVIGAAAGNLGVRRSPAPDSRSWMELIHWPLAEKVFNFSFWGTLAGYLVWAAAAIGRGASLGLAAGVLKGEKGSAELMKGTYMVTISGVTTITQFGVAAIVIGVMIGAARGWSKVLFKIGVLFALAVARALFNSERLAVIELAIPLLVIAVRLLVLESAFFSSARWRIFLQSVPVFGSAVLVFIFGVFEYFRSWSTYYAGGSQGFWEFNVLRLLGYYVTALNNGALLVARIDTTGAPFFTFHFLWRFPVLSSLVNTVYPSLALNSMDTDIYMQILAREANPEFNNGGGLLLPIIDYGLAGALLYWLIIGLVCGLLYRWFREMRPAGLLLYPVFFIGVVEITRILYWGEGRVIPVYLILFPFAWACAAWRRRATKQEQRILCKQSR